MTILQQNSGGFNGTGSITVSLPAASSASNTVVVIVAGNTTVTTPSGWTLRTSQVNFMGHYLYDRAGGAQSYTFAFSGTGSLTWWVAEIPGTAPTYVGATSSNASSADTSYSTPTLTPTAGTRLLLASLASVTSGATVRTLSGWTAGFVEQADVCQPTQDYPMQGVALLDNVAANGTTAYSTTGTYSGSSTGRSAIIGAFTTTVSGGASNFTGSAGFTGAGTLSASGVASAAAAVGLSGSGTLTPTVSQVAVAGSAALSGVGTLTATGAGTAGGSAGLTGSGTLSATGAPAVAGSIALTGSGSLAGAAALTGAPADPAIGNVGSPSTSTGNTTTSTSQTLASTTVGDLNIITIDVSPLANTTDPGVPTIDGTPISTSVGGTAGGWTTVGTSWDTGSPGPRLTIVGRVRQAGDPTFVTVAWASAGNHAASVFSIPGGGFDTSAAGSWLEAAAIQPQSASSTAFPTPSLTTAHRGRLFAVYSNRTGGGPWTDSQGTLVASAQSTSSANMAVFDEGVQDPGTYSRTGTWTAATSVGNTAIFAIRSGVAVGSSYSGAAGFTGAGTLSATGVASSPGAINLIGVGTLAATGKPTAAGTVTLTGSGTLAGSSLTPVLQWLNDQPFYCAHRGGSGDWPEMTMYAYDQAVAWGVKALEISVWQCSTGEWVGSHDRSTLRVTGTDYDIPSTPWSTLSTLRTTVGNYPLITLDQLLNKYGQSRIIFVDNKRNTNMTGFCDYLQTFPNATARFVSKGYITATATAVEWKARGGQTWGYAYAADVDNGNVNTTNVAPWTILGMDYNAGQSYHDTLAAYGRYRMGHIIDSPTAKTASLNYGDQGMMVSKVTTVVPQTGVTGSAGLSGSGSLTAAGSAPTTGGTAALTGSGSLSAASSAAVSGAAGFTGSGSLSATGSASAAGSANLTGAGVLTVTTTPRGAGSMLTTGSGTLTATSTVAVTGAATLTGAGQLSATTAGNGAGSISLSGLGVLAATASAVTATGTATLGGTGTLGATGRAGVNGTGGLTGTGTLSASTASSSTGTAALTGAGTLAATGTATAAGTATLTGSGVLTAAYIPPPDPNAVIIRATSRLRLPHHAANLRTNTHRGDLR